MVKKKGLGVRAACVERDRGSHVGECAKVCIECVYVRLPMCHVLCMLIYLSIVYRSICVHVSVFFTRRYKYIFMNISTMHLHQA